MQRRLSLLLAVALLVLVTVLAGCAGLAAEETERTGKISGSVSATFPMTSLLGGEVEAGDLTVNEATVLFDDGSKVKAQVDLPTEEHSKLTEEGQSVRVEKREDVWFIVEVLD